MTSTPPTAGCESGLDHDWSITHVTTRRGRTSIDRPAVVHFKCEKCAMTAGFTTRAR